MGDADEPDAEHQQTLALRDELPHHLDADSVAPIPLWCLITIRTNIAVGAVSINRWIRHVQFPAQLNRGARPQWQ